MPNPESWIEPLNTREASILKLIAEGLSNREIAQKLALSLDTVKWYNKQIFSKLGVNSRTQAAAKSKDLEPEGAVDQGKRIGSNLPQQLTSFVGRENEVREITELLEHHRLITLTGPGGTGKTRLALRVGERAAPGYPDGVFLVELAFTSSSTFVANSIAQVLRTPLNVGETPEESLIAHLKPKRLLLILDNFEHLLDAAPLVVEMLTSVPGLTVLATSRERLNVSGEQEYPVSPLSLPEQHLQEPLDRLLEYESVNLFVQRARSIHPKLVFGEQEAPALVQISRRLDGLPLALELAASQVKIFPVERLAQRLHDNLGSLPAGPRDLPARQRTLQATIEWSYNLLSGDEQGLFSELSVYRGGGTLESIEQVCGKNLTGDLTSSLTALVDKNLVRPREGIDKELRFAMLETIREYAGRVLSASGRESEIRARHAEYFAGLAEAAAGEFRTERQIYWLTRLQADQENLREVLAWSLDGSETGYGVRLAAAMQNYWYYSGHGEEGRAWTDLALQKMESAPKTVQAGLLHSAGVIAYGNQDLKRSYEFHSQAYQLNKELGDLKNLAYSLSYLGMSLVGDPQRYEEAMNYGEEGLALARQIEDYPGMAQALNILGELARVAGDYEAARRYYEESLEVVRKTGETLRVAMLTLNLSYITYHQQEFEQALQYGRQALAFYRQMNHDYGIATTLAVICGPLTALGNAQLAAVLYGVSERILRELGARQQPADQVEIDHYIQEMRLKLGDANFNEAVERGELMGTKEAIELAFQE